MCEEKCENANKYCQAAYMKGKVRFSNFSYLNALINGTYLFFNLKNVWNTQR